MITRSSNPLPPAHMTANERQQEPCTLPGYGLVRLHARRYDLSETVRGTTKRPATQRARTER